MRYEILKLLKKKKDYVSGEEIAKRFNVSRTAVWKNISKLKSEGYSISSVSNKGYLLEESADVLNINEIGYENTLFFETIDSTNEECKRQALKGQNDGLLVVCNYQSAGKGRMGRAWVSENRNNLCMSLLLYPDIVPVKAPELTLIAGIAAAEAINSVTGLQTGIKWPNDVLINGKKAAGILTELSAEIDRIKYVIIGIGINVNNESFDSELKSKATSVRIESGQRYKRSDFIEPFTSRFYKYYEIFCKDGFAPLKDKYNSMCLNAGQNVRTVGKKEIEGVALGVDEQGSLLVRDQNGEIHSVFTGEVSLRRKDNSYI